MDNDIDFDDDFVQNLLHSDRAAKPKSTADSIKKSFEFRDDKPIFDDFDKPSGVAAADPLAKSARSDIDFAPRERETVPSLMSTAPAAPFSAAAPKRSTPKKSVFDDGDDGMDLLDGGPAKTKGPPAQTQKSAPAAASGQQGSRANLDFLFSGTMSGANSNTGSTSNLHADTFADSHVDSGAKRRTEVPESPLNDADGASFLSGYVPSGLKHSSAAAAPIDFSASLGFDKKSVDSPARARSDVAEARKPPELTSGWADIFGNVESTSVGLNDSVRSKRPASLADSADFDAKPTAAKETTDAKAAKADFDFLLEPGSQRASSAAKPPVVAAGLSRKNSNMKESPKLTVAERESGPEQERLRLDNRQLSMQMEALQRQNEREVQLLKELHASELEQQRNAYESKLSLQKKQLADREQLMQEQERMFAEQLAERDKLFADELARLRAERADQRARNDERLAQLEADRVASVERERSLRASHDKELREASRSVTDSLSQLVQSSLSEMKRAFAEHDLARTVEQLSRNTAELSRLTSRNGDTERAAELEEKENRLRKLETQLAARTRELDESEVRVRKLAERQSADREAELSRFNEERIRVASEKQMLDRAKDAFDAERRSAERQLDSALKDLERAKGDAKLEFANERAALAQVRENLQSERLRFENDRAAFADRCNQELLKLTETRNAELSKLKQVELELRSRTEMLKTDEEKLKTFQNTLMQKENELLGELQRIETAQKTIRLRENELEIRERQFDSRNELLEKSRAEFASHKQQSSIELEELRRGKLELEKRAEAVRRAELELQVAEQKLVEERVSVGAQLRELDSKRSSFVCQACRQPVRDIINQQFSADARNAETDETYAKYMPREAAGLEAISAARQLRMRLDSDSAMRNFMHEAEQDQRFLEEERVFLSGISALRHPNF